MLFRDKNGKIVEVNKKDFIHDIDYYNKIASIYETCFNVQVKQKTSTMQTILTIVK